MKALAIAKDLTLPLDAVTQKLAFLGRTGSGKTYGATKVAEEMLEAGAQIVALDPVGVWWGLRLDSDGKTPSGFDLPVFGGLHGDIPLEPTSGNLLADLIVDRGISAILDVSQFESDADKARFARDFASRFFFRKKAAPSAVHVFVEECQEFVPQNPMKGEEQMLHAFHRLIKLGRNFGIGVSLISQRPQEVNKKVLNQTELMLAFQMTGPQERKAISAWVSEKGADEDVADVLPRLAVGEPHVWSPQWLDISRTVKISAKRSFNASSTPTVGAKAVEARPLGSIDLEKLQKAMASTIEKAKADDPKALRSEIAALRRQLEGKGKAPARVVEKAVPDQRAIDLAVRRATDAMQREDRRFRQAVKAEASRGNRAFTQILASIEQLRTTLAAIDSATNAQFAPESKSEPRADLAQALDGALTRGVERRVPVPVAPPSIPAEGLSGAQQKILDAVATLNELGVNQPTLVQVALFVGVSHTTGSYQQNVRNLADAGFLGRASGQVVLTGAGKRVARPDVDRDPIEFWKQKLPGAQSKLLGLILDHAPISREDLAIKAGVSHTTGSYQQNLRDMRTYGIIEIESGQINVSELLSPHAYA